MGLYQKIDVLPQMMEKTMAVLAMTIILMSKRLTFKKVLSTFSVFSASSSLVRAGGFCPGFSYNRQLVRIKRDEQLSKLREPKQNVKLVMPNVRRSGPKS